MKKIVLHFVIFGIIALPVFVDGAAQCANNLTPSLTANDPACWISTTSTSTSTQTESCRWVGPVYDDMYYIQCCYPGGPCRNVYLSWGWQRGGNGYWCGNNHFGTGPGGYNPSSYANSRNISSSTTNYSCYYTTVNTWGTCDVNRGIQVATRLNYLTQANSTNCDNLREANSQTCGVCTPGANINVTQMPTTNGICAFGTPTTPVLANDVWTWKCKGSNDNIADDDAACSVPNNVDGACNSTATGDYAWNATGFTGELCTSGTPTIDKNTSFPGYGQTVTWGCNGIGTGTSTTSNACRATRGTPPPCDCGPANDTTSTNKPTSGLCDVGNASSVSGSTVWQWTCGTQDGAGVCTTQAQCSAECIDISINSPEFVYLQKNGTTIEARITVQGRSHTNGVSCTLNGQNVTFSGTNDTSDPVTVPVSGAQTTLTAVCEITDPCGGNAGNTRTYTKSQKVQSVCTQRTCSTQGTCQTTPQPASTPDDCTSSCNSDADCSSGRMIETLP